MNNFLELTTFPGLDDSRAARLGQQLIRYGTALRVLPTALAIALVMAMRVASVSAQTPSGSFFNGNSGQLGNSLRSITFFLAAAMIIAGIIYAVWRYVL